MLIEGPRFETELTGCSFGFRFLCSLPEGIRICSQFTGSSDCNYSEWLAESNISKKNSQREVAWLSSRLPLRVSHFTLSS
ncbi:hypothetical protein PEX1_055060 [Penicillium expansum]|uniref:Uncharacterized protein n=1 Tax=Penicillium expansum TaxID=27334 RepID=A0A0A2JPW8_PENEN|nr:hypothetical protein PEX2_070340 [Penicillium expansum]KGO49160.1 hypothetical protein PEXP_012090 [Penicillium expansum]KGO54300.1 hypothetical protein PEX1_055060 [Penicillium expansum]KGO58670.1 hypothetical protein PEX2_070340 [Penicillium expansum]